MPLQGDHPSLPPAVNVVGEAGGCIPRPEQKPPSPASAFVHAHISPVHKAKATRETWRPPRFSMSLSPATPSGRSARKCRRPACLDEEVSSPLVPHLAGHVGQPYSDDSIPTGHCRTPLEIAADACRANLLALRKRSEPPGLRPDTPAKIQVLPTGPQAATSPISLAEMSPLRQQ